MTGVTGRVMDMQCLCGGVITVRPTLTAEAVSVDAGGHRTAGCRAVWMPYQQGVATGDVTTIGYTNQIMNEEQLQ